MKAWPKTLLAVLMVAAFAVASVLCCTRMVPHKASAKVSCCHAKANGGTASQTDCPSCNSILKSADAVHTFGLTVVHAAPVAYHAKAVSFKPVALVTPVFANGPPGLLVTVPLYIQQHSLRI